MLFRTVVQGLVVQGLVVQGLIVQGLVEGLQFVSWQQALVQPVAEDSSADNSAKNQACSPSSSELGSLDRVASSGAHSN